MSIEKIPGSTQEKSPDLISRKLIEMLGTTDIPFCFRTANGSIYVADKKSRTARYKAKAETFQPASHITVFLDHAYLDDQLTPRDSEQYLPNSLVHENGFLVLEDQTDSKESNPIIIKSVEDIPESIDLDTLKSSLFFIVFDRTKNKIIKKAPVSIVPRIGYHPIEFGDLSMHPQGHRNHFGNSIENITFTDTLNEEGVRKAIENLAITNPPSSL